MKLAAVSPGATYDILLADGSTTGLRVRWKSLPSQLTESVVSLLLASCFWWNDDKQGDYAAETERLVQKFEPAFRLLVGDQVYQDWPADYFDLRPALSKYRERYEAYWSAPSYAPVLRAVPSVFVCDDHEFWNDAPEFQVHLSRTHSAASRAEYFNAGAQLFDLYQASCNPDGRRWFQFALEPASFFVADTRSERTIAAAPQPGFLGAAQWEALEGWIRGLRGPGFLVLGQPFFQKDGDFRDHSLSNFRSDYARLCTLLRDSLHGRNSEGKPHHVVILTGDIHCGRLCRAAVSGAPRDFEHIYEFVASPASRISPYTSTPSMEYPPQKIPEGVVDPVFTSVEIMEPGAERPGGLRYATIHNNLGVVSLARTTLGVRAEFRLFCVRPYNHVHFWEKVPRATFPHPGREIFSYTLDLR